MTQGWSEDELTRAPKYREALGKELPGSVRVFDFVVIFVAALVWTWVLGRILGAW